MMNFDIKRKINTLRDILVGKVPDPKAQVEQITIALIYKFMDDMDLEGAEFGGERVFFTGDVGDPAAIIIGAGFLMLPIANRTGDETGFGHVAAFAKRI